MSKNEGMTKLNVFFQKKSLTSFRRGFSLIELLVVIAIVAALGSLTMAGLKGIGDSNSLSQAIGAVQGTLEQARSYAMSNNTYVYVGFAETDVTDNSTGSYPKSGIGRLSIAAVAVLDGTPGYDPLSSLSWLGSGTGLSALGKRLQVDNIHYQIGSALPKNGSMARDDATILLNKQKAATPFQWPVGSSSGSKIEFDVVVQFSPQGSANFVSSAAASTTASIIEIGLQPCRGNVAPPTPSGNGGGNYAAIQIDGVTGAVRVYRP